MSRKRFIGTLGGEPAPSFALDDPEMAGVEAEPADFLAEPAGFMQAPIAPEPQYLMETER